MELQILKDARYMLTAIDEAIFGVQEKGLAYGAQVGCVVVGRDGTIVSRAHNSYFDGIRRHAEEIAIAGAGKLSSGATLYVTIEPCNGNPYHKRRHCCEQIVGAGIERVVIGSQKRVYEGGADLMAGQGVAVELLENSNIKDLCTLLMANRESGAGLSERVVGKVLKTRNQIGKLSWADGLQ